MTAAEHGYDLWVRAKAVTGEYLQRSLGGSPLATVDAHSYESPVIARARAKGRQIIEWDKLEKEKSCFPP